MPLVRGADFVFGDQESRGCNPDHEQHHAEQELGPEIESHDDEVGAWRNSGHFWSRRSSAW